MSSPTSWWDWVHLGVYRRCSSVRRGTTPWECALAMICVRSWQVFDSSWYDRSFSASTMFTYVSTVFQKCCHQFKYVSWLWCYKLWAMFKHFRSAAVLLAVRCSRTMRCLESALLPMVSSSSQTTISLRSPISIVNSSFAPNTSGWACDVVVILVLLICTGYQIFTLEDIPIKDGKPDPQMLIEWVCQNQ